MQPPRAAGAKLGTDVIHSYKSAGGSGQIWSQLTLSWDLDHDEAIARAHRVWPNTALPGQLAQDLPTVLHFEQAAKLVKPSDVEASMPCGPDAGPILDSIEEARASGIDHIYLNQIGDPLEGFLDFWSDELKPRL